MEKIYRVAGHLVDLGLVCCFVCHILLGQVGIRQNAPW